MRMKGKVLLVLICALAVALLYSANALQSSSENSNSGARSQGISMVKLVEIIQSPPVGKLIISGDEFTITYVVENVGTAAAPDFAFKIPDLPQGVRMVKEPRPQTIPPGERAEFTFVFQAVAEGEYELTAQAFDKGDFISRVSLPIVIAPRIIDVKPVKMTASPDWGKHIHLGDHVRYTVSLRNFGTAPAQSVEFKPATIPDGVKLVDKSPPGEIKPNEVKDFTLKFLYEKAGTYEIPLVIVVNGETIEYGTLSVNVSYFDSITWPLLVALAAIVIIVALALYRRKRRVAAAPPSAMAPPAEPTSRFCIHCGVPIKASAKFCGKCGKPQQE